MNRLFWLIALVRNVQARYAKGSVRLSVCARAETESGKLGGTADFIRPMCKDAHGIFCAHKQSQKAAGVRCMLACKIDAGDL